MLNAFVIEPEARDLTLMKNIITHNCPNVNIRGLTSSISEARTFFERQNANLIFINAELALTYKPELLSNFSTFGAEGIFTSGSFNLLSQICNFKLVDF